MRSTLLWASLLLCSGCAANFDLFGGPRPTREYRRVRRSRFGGRASEDERTHAEALEPFDRLAFAE